MSNNLVLILKQVYWLIISIIWGSLHLLRARGTPERGDKEWGFGQIMPMISLAAPLIAVSGYFLSGQSVGEIL